MHAPAPHRAYLVCATPRSGSTLLCEGLAGTGVAGRPDEYFEQLAHTGLPRRPREYFDGLDDPEVVRLLPSDDRVERSPQWSRDDYARHLTSALRTGTTDNGVFAAKLMWGYLSDFLRLMRGIPRFAGVDDDAALLDAAFPELRYVFVSRSDKVRQAVSLWRALQTQEWRQEDGRAGADPEVAYSFDAIDHLLDGLRRDEDAWRGWFHRTGLRPLALTYEEVAGDLEGSVRRVLDHLGLTLPAGRRVDPGPMRRQSDELSESWVRAYLEDGSRRR
jgi:trehalose 2-sulfotransferase